MFRAVCQIWHIQNVQAGFLWTAACSYNFINTELNANSSLPPFLSLACFLHLTHNNKQTKHYGREQSWGIVSKDDKEYNIYKHSVDVRTILSAVKAFSSDCMTVLMGRASPCTPPDAKCLKKKSGSLFNLQKTQFSSRCMCKTVKMAQIIFVCAYERTVFWSRLRSDRMFPVPPYLISLRVSIDSVLWYIPSALRANWPFDPVRQHGTNILLHHI